MTVVIVDGNGTLMTERVQALLDVYTGHGDSYYLKTVATLKELTAMYSPLKSELICDYMCHGNH